MSFGIIERSSTSRPITATCRITLVPKKDGTLRACFDGRIVNKLLLNSQGYFPNLVDMVHRASRNSKFKTQLDFQSAYFQRAVEPKSRKFLGVWLPDEKGRPTRYCFTRSVWGLHASATHMVNFVHKVMQELPPDLLGRIAYYVDDVVIPSDTFEQHHSDLRTFFTKCREHGLTIHPKKTRIACEPNIKFLGYRCGMGQSSMSDDNVEAIMKIPHPTNRSELRHVLGVFSTARNYVRDYARIAVPLYRLTKKDVPYIWGDEQKDAFVRMQRAIQKQHVHVNFDPQLPLVIHCDASQYAAGAWLAQVLPNGDYRSLAYYSTTLSPTQTTWSAFMREAWCLLWALTKCEVYMNSSRFPTLVYSDAHSLQFVQASTRTELSSRLLARVSHLRFRVLHIPGRSNIIADALSRFKQKGIREMADATKKEALTTLLSSLPEYLRHKKRLHLYYAAMQQLALEDVRSWRDGRSKICTKHPKHLDVIPDMDFTIVHVHPHEQVRIAQKLFDRDRPFATLMCLDLVSRIFVTDDSSGERIDRLMKQVSQAVKRVFICRNHVWLIHKVDNMQSHVSLPTLPVSAITAVTTRSGAAKAKAAATTQTRSRTARAHSRRRYHTGRRNQPRRRVTARQSTKSAVQNTTVDITTDDTSVHNSYVPSDVTHHDAAARNLTPAPVDDPTPARAHSQRRYHTGRRNDPIPAATATNANVGRADGPFSEVSGDNIATSDSARDNGTQQPLATIDSFTNVFWRQHRHFRPSWWSFI